MDVAGYYGVGAVKPDNTSFRSTAYSARNMTYGSKGGPTRQYELLQGSQGGIVFVELLFQAAYLGFANADPPGNTQVAAQIE